MVIGSLHLRLLRMGVIITIKPPVRRQLTLHYDAKWLDVAVRLVEITDHFVFRESAVGPALVADFVAVVLEEFNCIQQMILHEFGNISNDVQRRQDARSGRLSHRLFSILSPTAAAADGRRWQIVGPGQILVSEPIRRPVHRSHQPRGGHRWQWAGEADGRAHHLGG
ncbi:hypothetical protein DAPPUDRAFT_117178 [Daphnia pulex]|uniref:Uncharacterized protein n=1 Tax=Daphnia pulex TaxID=6669 RepID=E9HRS6_DAPPU|nr:hypothetical protein DAPPUDRAFT_117178 [Daphnia pulex]|eukprot:EFX65552.1 hypothetical protein DAPPUDRAFT_117178 [Daphnia pulex]